MPKHQVIRDVGQSLLGVLRAELSNARAKGKAHLATPTAEFLRKNSPCIVLYLYGLRPSFEVRKDENWQLEEEITDDKRETHVVRYAPPPDLTLNYLLTAAADHLAAEHQLLPLGMRAFLDHPRLSGSALVGDTFIK